MNEICVRLARALAGLSLAFALPARATDDIAADWRTLLTEGDGEAIYATYDLIDAVTVDGVIDAARCRDNAEAIAKALVTNPVGRHRKRMPLRLPSPSSPTLATSTSGRGDWTSGEHRMACAIASSAVSPAPLSETPGP